MDRRGSFATQKPVRGLLHPYLASRSQRIKTDLAAAIFDDIGNSLKCGAVPPHVSFEVKGSMAAGDNGAGPPTSMVKEGPLWQERFAASAALSAAVGRLGPRRLPAHQVRSPEADAASMPGADAARLRTRNAGFWSCFAALPADYAIGLRARARARAGGVKGGRLAPPRVTRHKRARLLRGAWRGAARLMADICTLPARFKRAIAVAMDGRPRPHGGEVGGGGEGGNATSLGACKWGSRRSASFAAGTRGFVTHTVMIAGYMNLRTDAT
ncbi:hypothetical protein T492DRAFT_1149084 [Pavlovales sp. CCMP2436]|nr:hypothetical protein T492DRAFT_1149084 [Pavlovales sp. CCMP2436]